MNEAGEIRVGIHLLAEDLTSTQLSIHCRYDWFGAAHVHSSARQHAYNIAGNLPERNRRPKVSAFAVRQRLNSSRVARVDSDFSAYGYLANALSRTRSSNGRDFAMPR
jgi:hypothetical protein